jgi:hypothetical protein
VLGLRHVLEHEIAHDQVGNDREYLLELNSE